MLALILYLGIVLVVLLVCISVTVVKEGCAYIIIPLWLIAIMSVALGMCIEYGDNVLASDYLESPDSYQVDTFMVNGVLDHYEVSEKSK